MGDIIDFAGNIIFRRVYVMYGESTDIVPTYGTYQCKKNAQYLVDLTCISDLYVQVLYCTYNMLNT